MGRWGEKVPAAVGTVADRLALLQLGALHLQGAFLPADDAGASAIGTELLLAQGIGLLFQEGLQGALGKAGGGGTGALLHGIQIDVEAGAVVAEGASGNDLAPAGGKVAEFLKFLGGEGASWHVASCLAVETKTRGKRAPVKVCPRTSQSKAVHDLQPGRFFLPTLLSAKRSFTFSLTTNGPFPTEKGNASRKKERAASRSRTCFSPTVIRRGSVRLVHCLPGPLQAKTARGRKEESP